MHGAFGEYFVKTGLFDAKYHRWLLNAFDRRILGDYGAVAEFSLEEVDDMISQAKEFLQQARHYLEKAE